MVGPFTPNAGFIVPNTGDLVDTWGEDALNPDYVAIDGMLCGVQSISLSNVPVTLTSEAGFTATPGAGPTQSQNRVLRLSGTLSADVTITLPIPASYVVENLTTGNFDVILRGVTATEVIAVPQGEQVNVYNDGARVRFVGLGRVGQMDHWAGISAMPSWVGKCTVPPYLLADGTASHLIATYPYLGSKFGSKFGGNGLTTFGVPDLRGRVPLAYDGTGTRITTAGSGVDGQTVGSAGGSQNVTLVAQQIPSITASNASQSITVDVPGGRKLAAYFTPGLVPTVSTGALYAVYDQSGINGPNITITSLSGTNSISATYANVSQQVTRTVPPAQVTGIWVIKT